MNPPAAKKIITPPHNSNSLSLLTKTTMAASASTNTPMQQFILEGNHAGMREWLKQQPADAVFTLYEWKPIRTLDWHSQVAALKALMDDKRFVFDDFFVAYSTFFTTAKVEIAICDHKRMRAIHLGYTNSFFDYYERRFPEGNWDYRDYYTGPSFRFLRMKKFLMTELRAKVLFFLYPTLVRHVRNFKERYYAPGTGAGYLKGKARFEQLVKA